MDKDAKKIPLPEWQEKDNYRASFVRFRRRTAAELLGFWIAHKSVIPVLTQIAQDEKDNKRVRIGAVIALSRIKDKSIVPALVDLLSTDLRGNALLRLRMLLGSDLQKRSGEAEVKVFFGLKPSQSD